MSDTNINAYCAVCGTGYHVCNSCLEQRSIKPWRTVTDTIEHYKIYMAVHGYTVSRDKEKAKKDLSACDLSNITCFTSDIRKVIEDILSQPVSESENQSPKTRRRSGKTENDSNNE